MKILLATTCWWPGFARFAQLLVDMGCDIAVLCPTGHQTRVIRGITVLEQSAFNPLHALSDAISRFDPVFIVPGDERVSHHLHRLHASGTAQERRLIERSLGAPEHYATTVSRVKLLETAQRLDIRIPVGQAVTNTADLVGWLDRVPAPWVFKVEGSWGGMGVITVATRKAAFAAHRRLRRQSNPASAAFRMAINRDAYWMAAWLGSGPAEVSVQSFIEGCPGDLAMFCWEGEVLAAVMGEAVVSIGENRPTSIIRLINRPDIMEAATRLARDMGLTGFYGLDFMIEAATNRVFLLEMNPRPTALTNIRVEPGRDLLGALVTTLSGAPCPAPARLPESALVAYFPQAWQEGGHPDETHPGAFHDIPSSEPALMAEMLRPRWPERRFLARLEHRFWRTVNSTVGFMKNSPRPLNGKPGRYRKHPRENAEPSPPTAQGGQEAL